MKKILTLCLMIGLCNMGAEAQVLNKLKSAAKKAKTELTNKAKEKSKKTATETASSNQGGLGNLLNTVLGNGAVSESMLVGDWHYVGSSCVFESSNVLKSATGTVAANQLEKQLDEKLTKAGFNQNSCTFSFKSDKTFKGKIAGKPISGTYELASDGKSITLTLLKVKKVKCYTARSTRGISLLIEGSKLKTVLSVAGGLTGNASIKALTSFLNTYDGMLVGIELEK